MLLIFGNQMKAQSGIDFLYDNLQFTNGVCQKTIDVTYLSVGKNPISHGNDKDDAIRKIKEQIKYLPHSSVHFSYKEKEYYISISDEYDLSSYSKGDKIRIDIVFFEDIKQPYKYEKPFSFITSVTDSPLTQGNSSLPQPSKHRLVLDHPVNLGDTLREWKEGYGYILPPRDQFLKCILMSYNGIDYALGLSNNDIIRFIGASDKRFSVNGYKVGDEITRTNIIRGWGIIAKIDNEWYAAWMPKDINHPEEEEMGKIEWFFKFDFHAPLYENKDEKSNLQHKNLQPLHENFNPLYRVE